MSFNNGYIESVGKKFLKNYLGCFPSDLQPNIRKAQFGIIFNLSKHDEEGTHYIAIHSDREKLVYFDSFGQPIKNKLIKVFVKKHLKNKKFQYNKTQIQDDQSSFCGIFCLSFLASQERNISLQDFVKMFNKEDLKINDKKTVDILKFFIAQ